MEMEQINDNLIKVVIEMEDLEERGIDFFDLMRDQSEVEHFFYSILEEVEIDQSFLESDAITFQVMPSKSGLELYISRSDLEDFDIIWQEEVARRMASQVEESERERKSQSKKANSNKDKTTHRDHDNPLSFIEMIENEFRNNLIQKPQRPEVIKFEQLEDFLSVARQYPIVGVEADLYHLEQAYYMVLRGSQVQDSQVDQLEQLIYTVLEFGELSDLKPEVLAEHGQLIRANDILIFFGKNL